MLDNTPFAFSITNSLFIHTQHLLFIEIQKQKPLLNKKMSLLMNLIREIPSKEINHSLSFFPKLFINNNSFHSCLFIF